MPVEHERYKDPAWRLARRYANALRYIERDAVVTYWRAESDDARANVVREIARIAKEAFGAEIRAMEVR